MRIVGIISAPNRPGPPDFQLQIPTPSASMDETPEVKNHEDDALSRCRRDHPPYPVGKSRRTRDRKEGRRACRWALPYCKEKFWLGRSASLDTPAEHFSPNVATAAYADAGGAAAASAPGLGRIGGAKPTGPSMQIQNICQADDPHESSR